MSLPYDFLDNIFSSLAYSDSRPPGGLAPRRLHCTRCTVCPVWGFGGGRCIASLLLSSEVSFCPLMREHHKSADMPSTQGGAPLCIARRTSALCYRCHHLPAHPLGGVLSLGIAGIEFSRSENLQRKKSQSFTFTKLTSFKKFFLMCISFERERERERETQNPKRAPGSELSTQSPMWGSNRRTVRS